MARYALRSTASIARGISALSYRSAVGLGMADVIHDRLYNNIDWNPTRINSLTASTPAAVRTPLHYAYRPRGARSLRPDGGGKTWLMSLTAAFAIPRTHPRRYQREPSSHLASNVKAISEPFALEFDSAGDLAEPVLAFTPSNSLRIKFCRGVAYTFGLTSAARTAHKLTRRSCPTPHRD